MSRIYVVKADGSKELFNRNKILRTCRRAGVSKGKAEHIVDNVQRSVYDGITTKQVYHLVLNELSKLEPKSSFSYKIREAIAKIGPENFELYVKKVLESNGYECKWNRLVKGKAVTHQVDLIAKNKGLFMVEVKHHVNPHRMSGLGDVLQIQARLEDIKDGFKGGLNKHNFTQAWLLTNTKVSAHAKRYAKAKNIIVSGWNYKGSLSLENLVKKNKAYPITALNIDTELKNRLIHKGILTVLDLHGERVKKILGKDYEYIISKLNKLSFFKG